MHSPRVYIFIVFLAFSALFFSSCGLASQDSSGQIAIDFTVVEDADLPEELKKLITDKKEAPFKLSYSYEGYLYIVQGYGTLTTGGYSISVTGLYEKEDVVYFETTLLGPAKDEKVSEAFSYPYIVVKIEDKDMNVVFA